MNRKKKKKKKMVKEKEKNYLITEVNICQDYLERLHQLICPTIKSKQFGKNVKDYFMNCILMFMPA